MPWSKIHRKEKFAELDKKRRPKRRNYFKEYYHNRIKNNKYAIAKCKIRLQSRRKYGKPDRCIICDSKYLVTWHHYTEPYEVDKIIPVCEYHHIILDYIKRCKNKEDDTPKEGES